MDNEYYRIIEKLHMQNLLRIKKHGIEQEERTNDIKLGCSNYAYPLIILIRLVAGKRKYSTVTLF